MYGFCSDKTTGIAEKINPARHHKIKVFIHPISRIIFLINTASVPEQISAAILNKIALELPFMLPEIKNVPYMINSIAKIAIAEGISFKNIMPKIIAMIGL